MTDYLIAAVLFVAIITTLVYLWKRASGVSQGASRPPPVDPPLHVDLRVNGV